MKKSVCFLIVLALALVIAAPARAQNDSSAPTPENMAKLASLLPTTGYVFKQHNSSVWSVDVQGKTSQKTFRLIVSTGGDAAVIFITVTPKATLPATPDFLQKLLRFNHSLDQVKVGLDRDDDLSVRVDARMRILDEAELTAIIHQVINSSDEIYKQISPYLLPQN